MEPLENNPVDQAQPTMFQGKTTSSPLAAVCRHLNRSMAHIQEQLELISQQLQNVNMDDCDHVDGSVDDVDAEITRYREILQRMDELELDFDRMKNIREIARALQRRAERTDRVKDGLPYHGRALRQRTAKRHRLIPGVRHLRASQRAGSVGGIQQDPATQPSSGETPKANPPEGMLPWNDTTTLRGPESSGYPPSGNEHGFLVKPGQVPDGFKLVPDVPTGSHFWLSTDGLQTEAAPQLYGDSKTLFLGHEDLREAVAIALYRETSDRFVETPTVFPVDMVNHNVMDLGSSPEAAMETDSMPTADSGLIPNEPTQLDTMGVSDAIHSAIEIARDPTKSSNNLPPYSERANQIPEQNKMDVQYITTNDTRSNSQLTIHPMSQPGIDYSMNENGGMNLVEKIALWQNMMED